MQVLKQTTKGYRQDPTKQFRFDRYEGECSDFVLIEAAFEDRDRWKRFELTDERLEEIRKNRIVRLEFEEPNKFFLGDQMDSYDEDFYKIFTLCPYTSDWLNKKHGVERRVPIFFPFNEEDVPSVTEKEYDIIYTGHIVSPKLLGDLRTMTDFNYRFVSNQEHRLVTDRGASYHAKIELISKSKITLVHNLLYPTKRHIKKVWQYDGWVDNKAFCLIPNPSHWFRLFTDRNIVVPQLKSRPFEAAFSRSLILCKHDHFNIIERYFDPSKEFVYYEDGQLKQKIEEILANFDDYEAVIENAHQRAIANYTTSAFVEKYLKNI